MHLDLPYFGRIWMDLINYTCFCGMIYFLGDFVSYVLVSGYVNALRNGGNELAHFPLEIPEKTLGVPRPLHDVYDIWSLMTM